MTITEISIKRPSLIIVIFTVLILGGIFSYSKLNYELLPSMSMPTLTVVTQYPGASPTDVNQTTTIKVEDAVTGMSQLRNLSSQSYEGVSVVTLEFESEADIDKKQQETQRILNNLMYALPAGVKTPSVSKFSMSDMPVLRLTAVSKMSDRDFYTIIDKEIVPQLKQIKGVGNVALTGGIERQIKVNVDKDRLATYGISLAQVAQAINSANLDYPTGKVDDNNNQMTVRLAGKFNSVDQLKNMIVESRTSAKIRLQDVAEIIDGVKEQTTISRFNGQDGIGISITKQTDANAVDISKKVREEISKIESQYKDSGVKFIYGEDTSEMTMEAVQSVTHDLFLAVILVALVILIFLHSLRDSFIVMVAIPTSIVSTFIAMYFFGYSLNLMTLLGMSLVIGILVDDSIVVLENIHRHFSMGKDRRQAALDGRNEIGFSALAITMVDVVVFLPIALVGSTIGDLLREFAVTIVVSTLMSLFVSFTLTPFLYSRFGKKLTIDPNKWFHLPIIWVEKQIKALSNFYASKLAWVLNHKIITSAFILGLFVVTGVVASLGITGEEMSASGDGGRFTLNLEYDKGVTIYRNNIKTREIESFIQAQPNVQSVLATIGGGSDGSAEQFIGITTENKSSMTITLVDREKRTMSTEKTMLDIREKLEKKFLGVKLTSSVVGLMAGMVEPIMLVVTGKNHAEMMQTAEKIKTIIAKIPGAYDPTISVTEGNPEVNIAIDREKVALLGLSIAEVGSTLQSAFAGNTDAKFRDGQNEYDIKIQLDKFNRKNINDVSGFTFINSKGQSIALSEFASITQGQGPSMVERTKRTESVTVKSNLLGVTSGVVSKQIDEEIAKANFSKEVTVKWSGDVEQQNEAFASLGLALLAAVILIYLVMVALYNSFIQPFIVFFSVPVALIGAILALNITMGNMSIFSMLGMIMLLGLVAKNGILLVDFANHQKELGMSAYEALLEAGRERLRPILMTTTAMVIGMLPIALATGAGAEWKNDLAVVLIGGLTSSLILTLFVVPMVYLVADKIQHKRARRKKAKTTLV